MKTNLTERQREILDFITQFRDANGYPPTLREIGSKFGISSTFGVKRHLEALQKKGYLTVESNASRGISIVDSGEEVKKVADELPENREFRKIPVVGRVAAGVPITAAENVEGSIVMDSNYFRGQEQVFSLQVKGDSMIEAGIFEGDYVVVSSDREVVNHDIVVGIIDGEATVKRFHRKDGYTALMPENKNYAPIDVTGNENFVIAGKVIGVVRWFN